MVSRLSSRETSVTQKHASVAGRDCCRVGVLMGSEGQYTCSHMPNDEAIELTGQYTMKDILRFRYFDLLRRRWWFVVLIAASLFVILGTEAIVGVFVWLVVVGLIPYLAARRIYKTSTTLGKPVVLTFSPDGVHTVTGYSSGVISWKAFWKIREARTFFALYPSEGSASILPKRFFASPTQREQWRELVNAQIQPKKILKPGVVGKLL
jgi:hypothetical protein